MNYFDGRKTPQSARQYSLAGVRSTKKMDETAVARYRAAEKLVALLESAKNSNNFSFVSNALANAIPLASSAIPPKEGSPTAKKTRANAIAAIQKALAGVSSGAASGPLIDVAIAAAKVYAAATGKMQGAYKKTGTTNPLKKIVTAAKDVVKMSDKIHNTIHKGAQKILPKKVRKAIEKVEDDPRFKKIHDGVKIAVASYYLGPIAGKIFGATAGAVVGKATAALGVKGSIGSTLAASVSKGMITEGAKTAIQQKLKVDAKKLALKGAKENADLITEISRSPQYSAIVTKMRADGLTDNDMAEMWRTSDIFKTLATAGAINQTAPIYTDAYISAGIPQNVAEDLGVAMASEVATKEVANVSQSNIGKIAVIAIPLLFAVFGGS
jgi:hypothetical protein